MRDRSKEYPLNGEQDSLLAGKEKNVTEIVRMGKLTKPSEVDSLNMKISSKDGNELIVISAQEYQRIIKETKTYKVVTTLDVLFASFFIAPCVVGYWRGTWILIDKNPQYFPIWATLLFSTILNIGLTILRGRFTYYSTKFQNETNWKLLPKIGMLVYSYVSTVSSIITWRALWAIVDHYTGVQYIKGDRVSVETSQQVLIVGLVCLLGTIAMKCCKTGLGVPFCIAVDTIENTFEFPTRYKIEILYIVMISVRTNVSPDKLGNNTPAPQIIAEKIIYAESRRSSRINKLPPQPFINNYIGPTPVHFTPTTDKATTARYPQLNEYRHRRHHPKNIQDIIAFMTFDRQRGSNNINNNNNNNIKFESYNGDSYREPHGQFSVEQRRNRTSNGFSLSISDPFYSYKPQDPSDINLLATGNVRFAPPIWKTFKRGPAKAPQPQVDTSNKQEIYNNEGGRVHRKPVIISLNIFPFNDENKDGYGQASAPYKIEAFDTRVKAGSKQEKMIIHLNIFPENVAFSENAQESRLRGNFVGYVRDGI